MVVGESGEVGDPGTLGMTKKRVTFSWKVVDGSNLGSSEVRPLGDSFWNR
jgi:hypothetical protein